MKEIPQYLVFNRNYIVFLEVIMFLYDITKETNQLEPIFDQYPTLATLSHSFNDPHWSFPYHVHKEETELIYFSKGQADYEINT